MGLSCCPSIGQEGSKRVVKVQLCRVEYWGEMVQTTEQHQSMQDNQVGRLRCVVQVGIVPRTLHTKQTRNHILALVTFYLLSSDLASLTANLIHPAQKSTYLYFQRSTATTVTASSKRQCNYRIKAQWSTARCLTTTCVSPHERQTVLSWGLLCLLYGRGSSWEHPGHTAFPTVRANVIILVITHTYKPACSPGTARASLWISALATLVDCENSQGGNMKPAAYFLACKTARKRSNFATSWYSGSLDNRNSGEPTLWKTE